MGLDIYHFHVQDRVTDIPTTIDVTQSQLAKLVPYSRKVTNQYIVFARLLTDHDFLPQDYRLALHQREMWGPGKFAGKYYFSAASDRDPMNPVNTGLYFTNKRSFFPAKPQLPPDILKKVKTFKVRQYPMQAKVDDVVYAERVGYQRQDVVEQFFGEFPPDGIYADRAYAERIFELTIPEAQPAFRSSFLDNWDESRSLVVVSW